MSAINFDDVTIAHKLAPNTKVHMAVDAFGLPIHFEITGGQVPDCKIAPNLVTKLKYVEYIIADRGYDSEPLRTQIAEKGASAVIPRKDNAKVGNDDIDCCLYK